MNDFDILDTIYAFIKCLASAVIICLVVLALGGCQTHRQVENNTTIVHDTLTQVINQRDSIYLHDSIYHEVTVHGDSVIVIKDRWHISYRDRWHHDSIYIHQTDTVTRECRVETGLTPWQKFRMHMGGIFMFVVVGLVVVYAMDYIRCKP